MALTLDIPNARFPDDDLVVGGQPARDQLAAAKDAGVRTIVNLRPRDECNEFDEAALVADMGLRYVHIPIAGPADLNRENAVKLDDALHEKGAAMVHCASGNRVGALMAYRARQLAGDTVDGALALGVAAGLQPHSPLYDAIRKALA